MRRGRILMIGLALGALVLAGCAPLATVATEAPTESPSATAPADTPTATATNTPTPDATSLPDPTETAMPGKLETPDGRGFDALPADEGLTRGNAYIEAQEVAVLENDEVQVRLIGSLPTPCHQLRAAIAEPDANDRIEVQIYSVTDPNMMCIQVLSEFDEAIPLGTYPSGTYTVWVNGELAGEFTI